MFSDFFKRRRARRPCSVTTPAGSFFNLYADMLRQPHLLVAGATGSGKSCVVNGLIYTALFRAPGKQPDGAQLVLIDPKRVELSLFRSAPHTLLYVSETAQFVPALQSVMTLCENRYRDMQRAGARLYSGGDVYIIIDEFADLILTAPAVKPLIQRLAQIGRAAKIHIILCTQTPIAKVLPTEIKCNFDARLALRTRSAQDSRNITGFAGCETLPRYGQGFYITPESTRKVIVPAPYDDSTLQSMVQFWTRQF